MSEVGARQLRWGVVRLFAAEAVHLFLQLPDTGNLGAGAGFGGYAGFGNFRWSG